MSKIKLTDEKLNEMLKNNYDERIEQYFEAAISGDIITTNKDSLLKLLFLLVRYYDDKLFCKTRNDLLDFFGMSKYDEKSEQARFLDLLDRTHFEIAECVKNGIPIPPSKVLVDFFNRYAHALYVFGHYFKSLEFCRKALSNDEENPLALFLKASVIELCYLNKTDGLYKVALYNYQKQTIKKCDIKKTYIDERICKEVISVIDMRTNGFNTLLKCISFIPCMKTLEETKKVCASWTEEKDFYLHNNLFLNPLNVFEAYISAANEEFEDLDIPQEQKELFNAILEDYKTCRRKIYEYIIEKKNRTKVELSMSFSYTYSIFDKLAYLIKKTYDLECEDKKVYFTDKDLFDLCFSGSNMKLKNIKNDNIWPLYLIMKDIRGKSTLGKLKPDTLDINKKRNYIEHRSTSLVTGDDLENAALTVLKQARDAIIYTFALLKTCSRDQVFDKVTTIGTTFHWAGKSIFDKKIYSDLI